MVNLNGMKRYTLQKLAKQHGIKANMKTEKIIAALEEVVNSNKVSITEMPSMSSGCETTETETSCDESPNESTPIKPKESNKRKLNETFDKSPSKFDDIEPAIVTNDSTVRRLTRSTEKTHSIEMTSTSATKRTRFAPKTSLENEIMEEVRRNIREQEQKTLELPGQSSKESFIPRFRATGVHVPGVDKTPGQMKWDKVHQKTFNKLESIDDYERRKQDRAQKLLGSSKGKQGRAISRLAQPVIRRKPSDRASKTILEKSNIKSSVKTSSEQFKPVLSTSKMNLNFTKKASRLATPKKVTIISDKPNTPPCASKTPHKPSTPGLNRLKPSALKRKTVTPARKTVTPARKTVIPARNTVTPSRKTVIPARKTVTPARKLVTPARKTVTPARNIETPAKAVETPSKKPVFDLQESLKKPLSWVPHKGPLKLAPQPKKSNFRERMNNYKQPRVGTRESRRAKAKENRESVKHQRMMSLRGVDV